MSELWYCPEYDELYEYCGEYLVATRTYGPVGGIIDETGASYYSGTFGYTKRDMRSFGWRKIGVV